MKRFSARTFSLDLFLLTPHEIANIIETSFSARSIEFQLKILSTGYAPVRDLLQVDIKYLGTCNFVAF